MHAHERPGVELRFHDHAGTDHGIVPHLRVPFATYFGIIDELIECLAGWGKVEFNQVVAIMSGGFTPARAIASAFRVPLAYVASESYDAALPGDGAKVVTSREFRFDRHLLKAHPGFGDRVLLVDDLADSGRTFGRWVEWLLRHPEYGSGLTITTACLWHKLCSTFLPDHYVDTVPALPVPQEGGQQKMPWIDQPMEYHYGATIDDIRLRVALRRQAEARGEPVVLP